MLDTDTGNRGMYHADCVIGKIQTSVNNGDDLFPPSKQINVKHRLKIRSFCQRAEKTCWRGRDLESVRNFSKHFKNYDAYAMYNIDTTLYQ